MDRSFTIGELARAAEVPTSTIRFYEREGLLSAVPKVQRGRSRIKSRRETRMSDAIRGRLTRVFFDDLHR